MPLKYFKTMTNKLDMEAAARYEFSTDVDYIENYFAIFYSLGNDPQKKDPHKMEGLMFIACVGGSLEVMLDLRKYMLQKNDLLIVLPGQVIQVLAKSPDFDGRFIFMSNEFLTIFSLRRRNFSTFFVIRVKPQICLLAQDMAMFVDYLAFIRSRMRLSEPSYRLDIIQNLVGSMFFEFMSMEKYMDVKAVKMSRKDEICSEFINLLIKHYKESRSVAFYADKLFITPKYLSATLRSVTGKKAGQLIDDYVLLQAKMMLKSTNMTVQQISEELSFANQSFFARYFKHLTGISPTQYRNN